MGSEHKKVMLAILILLFICLFAGTIFITIEVQHYAIGFILFATTLIIGIDIRLILKNKTPTSLSNMTLTSSHKKSS